VEAQSARGPWAEERRQFARRLVETGEFDDLDAHRLVLMYGVLPGARISRAVATAGSMLPWRKMTAAKALAELELLGGAARDVFEYRVRRTNDHELAALMFQQTPEHPSLGDDPIPDAAKAKAIRDTVKDHELVLLFMQDEDPGGYAAGNQRIWHVVQNARERARRRLES
jgi:hypothetical protein